MAHEESLENLTQEEKKFRFYMTRGDEFIKIEIFRNARKYFQQALEMNIDNEKALLKLKETEALIRQENRIFISLGISALVILGLVASLTCH